jgi:RNA polymerase sigma factor (sigma-70 family)
MNCAADRKVPAAVPATPSPGLPARPGTSAEARDRFEQLLQAHLRDAYELALWLTGSSAATEEVVHEGCLKAFRGIQRLGCGNGRIWLLTTVRGTAYEWVRRNRPEALQPGEAARGGTDPVAIHPASAAPRAAATAGRHLSLLRGAMAALPILNRETLVLREIHELSYREIATITAAPLATVMSRLACARETLTTCMKAARG